MATLEERKARAKLALRKERAKELLRQQRAQQSGAAGTFENVAPNPENVGDSLMQGMDRFGQVFAGAGPAAERAVAGVLGAPADISKIAVDSYFGGAVPTADKPLLGSDALMDAMERIGLAPRSRAGNELINNVMEEVSASAIPAGVVVRLASRLKVPVNRMTEILGAMQKEGRIAGRMADRPGGILSEIAQDPKRFALAEASAAAGAGVGRTGAENLSPVLPDAAEPYVQLGAELAGGMTPGTVNSIGGRLRKEAMMATGGGRENVAAEFLQSQTPFRGGAIENLSADPPNVPGGVFSSATLSGSRGLMGVERGMRSLDGGFNETIIRMEQATDRAMKDAMEHVVDEGDPRATKGFFEGRVESTVGGMRRAAERAEEAAIDATIMRGDDPENISTAAKEKILEEFEVQRANENEIWSDVPLNESVKTENTKAYIEGELNSLARFQEPDDLPAEFFRKLMPEEDAAKPGSLGEIVEQGLGDAGELPKNAPLQDVETLDSLKHLRTRVIREIKNDRADLSRTGDRANRLRILNGLNEAILEDMRKAAGSPELDAAIAFSKELHNKFTKGPVGSVLGFTAKGDERVLGTRMFDKILTPNADGGVNVQRVKNLARGDLNNDARDWVREKFALAAVDDGGVVNRGAAEAFVRRYRTVLQEFPSLGTEIGSAIKARKVSDMMRKSAERRTKAVKARSRASIFLEPDMRHAVRKLETSPNQGADVRQILRQAAKDKSGQALSGLRSQIVKNLMERATSAKDDRLIWSKFNAYRKANKDLINTSLLPHQSKILDEVGKGLKMADVASAPVVRGMSETISNASTLSKMIARIAGARVGGSLGGPGAIQGANIVSRKFVDIVGQIGYDQTMALIQEALVNPKMMKELLSKNVQQVTFKDTPEIAGYLFNLNQLPVEREEEISANGQ